MSEKGSYFHHITNKDIITNIHTHLKKNNINNLSTSTPDLARTSTQSSTDISPSLSLSALKGSTGFLINLSEKKTKTGIKKSTKEKLNHDNST